MWDRLTEEEKKLAIEAIPDHIRLWAATNTEKHFIPHAGSWLNPVLGRRWEDEIEFPQAKTKETTVAWWSTEATVIAKGNEYGLSPRPGEDIHTFKGRVIERIKQAA
jgi:hypothetical protein